MLYKQERGTDRRLLSSKQKATCKYLGKEVEVNVSFSITGSK